jgi:trk system potassium uptake protein TrkA
MYIVIVGFSELACELARLILKENKNKVVLVVKKKEEAMRITDQLGFNVVNADSTKPEVLDDLELDKCDVFISASDIEKDNILSAMYAKEAGAKKIFVRIDNPDVEDMLKKLGFISINEEYLAAHSVELMISRPSVSELVNVGKGEFDIMEVSALGTNLLGKELGYVRGKNYNAIATYCGGKYCFYKETKINEDDKVLLIVRVNKEKEIEKEIGKKSKQIFTF